MATTCLNCQAETNNPKFCSRSCSVTVNNKLEPKRKRINRTRSTPICRWCQINHVRIKSQKFCCIECYSKYNTSKLKHKTVYKSKTGAKKYLLRRYGNICSICGIQSWRDQPLVMIMDHIDGNSTNHVITNLRLVCPNCDSQLPTFKGRNKGNGRRSREQRS